MTARIRSLVWGITLSLGGVLILLFNLGVFDALRPGLEYFFAILASLAGLGFLGYYLRDRTQWWPVLPGFTLLGVAVMAFVSTVPGAPRESLTSVLFLALAAAFAVVYIADARNWWAIIPGGILLVLGVIILFSSRLTLNQSGVLLFVGIGLVFFLVYLLGPVKREVWWALIPGTALIVSGLFIYVLTEGQEQLLAKLWPLILIIGGLASLGRQLLSARAPSPGSMPEPSDSTAEGEGSKEASRTTVIELDSEAPSG